MQSAREGLQKRWSEKKKVQIAVGSRRKEPITTNRCNFGEHEYDFLMACLEKVYER